MARVIITKPLIQQVMRKLKGEAHNVFSLMKTLEQQPKKGKLLAQVGDVAIKELKYKSFRFYFITDGHLLKFGTEDQLSVLLIKFIKMSDKKSQQAAINKIKDILKSMGFEGFK